MTQSASSSSGGTPAADFAIDGALVRRLLRQQHPDLADLTIVHVDTGWDNEIYRLGSNFAVRMPRRRAAIQLIEHEQRWLSVLSERLPIAIPAPLRIGRPTVEYDSGWSVVPWLTGRPADLAAPDATESKRLAEFLLALHQSAPANAPPNPLRGVPLAERAEFVTQRIHRLDGTPDEVRPTVARLWRQSLDAAESTTAMWLHGDLHARNVLVDAGRICGVIDWGDITAGDVATDLCCVWMLLDNASARSDCLRRYGASQAQISRAIGWAVFYGTVLIETGLVDCPRHVKMGRSILKRLHEDADLFDAGD